MNRHTGWIPPDQRTKEQTELDEKIKSEMLPAFGSVGPKAKPIGEGDEFCQYRAFGNEQPPYAWQSTGSCVRAGGHGAIITTNKVEIVGGEAEVFHEFFTLFSYEVSRWLGGFKKQGDGSFGSSFFKAVVDYGMPRSDHPGLPQPQTRQGWRYFPESVEYEWSFNPEFRQEWVDEAAEHKLVPVKSLAQVRDMDELDAALTNGYTVTWASMYGTKTIREKDGLMVSKRDDSWAHQRFCDALKKINGTKYYRFPNSWGPDAHPKPTDDSPAGGFWQTEKEVADDLSDRDTEVFAISGVQGVPARDDQFWVLMDLWWKQMMGGG